jgi:hypothetical protein
MPIKVLQLTTRRAEQATHIYVPGRLAIRTAAAAGRNARIPPLTRIKPSRARSRMLPILDGVRHFPLRLRSSRAIPRSCASACNPSRRP